MPVNSVNSGQARWRLPAAGLALLALAAAGCGGGHGRRPLPPARPASSPAPTAAGSGTSAPASRAPSALPSACSTPGALAGWSVTRLAEQTVVVPVDEAAVGTISREVAAGAGGVILFGSRAPADLASSLAALVRLAPGAVRPLVMTDEEGGAVQRMPNLVGTLPSAREMAATMTAGQIGELARQAGRRMKAAGVSMDLAPVLDLDGGAGPNEYNADGTRSFSLDPRVATADGLAFAAGLRAAGVMPVVKHFPGLGEATGNTDLAAAATQPWSRLQQAGLLPFRAAVRAGIPAVMVANASVPGLTAAPASLSPEVITTVLRRDLGFAGLVLTDSLSAKAVRLAGYSVPAAAVAALRAGADMVLYNADASTVADLTARTVQAIAAAASSGALPRARLVSAVAHVLAAKQVRLCPG